MKNDNEIKSRMNHLNELIDFYRWIEPDPLAVEYLHGQFSALGWVRS